MKLAILGTLAGLGLLAAGGSGLEIGGEPSAPPRAVAVAPAGAGSELIVVPFGTPEKGMMLSVIDPRQRVMGVYRLDAGTGKIALKSVRNLRWDLQLNDFNNEPPLPQEIRSLIEQK
ncbi:MAG: hypothetical protein JXB10_12530 [Pirellulales bacterium]|nr:hypothetical protein [Pirellulales bacterium]